MLGPMFTIEPIDRAAVEPLLEAMRADELDVIAGEGDWLGARDAQGRLLGVTRVFDRDGHRAIDDVWVEPCARRRGIATALLSETVARCGDAAWLICDEPDVAFYAARGFAAVAAEAFPPALAAHYAAKNEWPAAPDHAHVAMRTTTGTSGGQGSAHD